MIRHFFLPQSGARESLSGESMKIENEISRPFATVAVITLA
jgi:hypothetical protein